MKLVVGLGNPGKEYENTRHNVGFMVIDKYTGKNGISVDKEKFSGLYGEAIINNEKVYFLKPTTYMNLSGDAIRKIADFYKIDVSDILIIHDDLDLPLGTYKIKPKGSSGGHNGLKSIESNLSTQEYKRIKIGISNDKSLDTKDYVLGKFSKEDKEQLDRVIDKVVNILEDYFKMDFDQLMSKYN